MSNETQDVEGIDIGKKHKIGHLRVDTQGNATFKRLPTNQLVEALQLGIQYSVGGLEARPAHDVLYQDFPTVEITPFPKAGRTSTKPTPPHRFNDFTMRSYAPVAFRHFREKFNIRPEDYLSSICKPFRELKNPGASGSLFYLTDDDEFIIKTVQKREAEFLRGLLPGYYMNIIQNQRTLLPKFFGLYCYQVTELFPKSKNKTGDNKNIRIVVMNNLIPSHIAIHQKYDLKGSTHKRRANNVERQKESPTWKDLDFVEQHPYGLLLDSDTYYALLKTIQRDCRVLASFQIMDYSLLIGIHYVDPPVDSSVVNNFSNETSNYQYSPEAKRMTFSTPMDNIQAKFDQHNRPDDHLAKTGGIPARTSDGRRIFLYVGIIDVLQSYQLRKKLEHTLKSVVSDGTQISVTHPIYYSERFQRFLFDSVFKKPPRGPDSAPTPSLTPMSRKSNSLNPILPYMSYSISTSSRVTSTSQATSIYSSVVSDVKTADRSSITCDGSSYQSDSLLNQPVPMRSPRIITTSFNKPDRSNNNPKTHYHSDLTRSPKTIIDKRLLLLSNGKTSSAMKNLSNRYNLSEDSSKNQEHHRSSVEITRL